jgi:hypothetical protein
MRAILQLVVEAFDVAVRPLAALSPVTLLTVAALAVAVATLAVMRRFSDQERLRTTKNRIKAHLLELWIFRDDVPTILRAQGRLLALNGRYLLLTLKPMIVLVGPVVLLLGALDPWFGVRPLHPGDATILSVRATDARALEGGTRLVAGDGIRVETPALRIPAANEIDWRIRALRPGVHTVSLEVAGQRLDKQVVAAEGPARVSASRLRSDLWQALLSPTEPSLPDAAGVERIDVRYPDGSVSVLGWSMHWLVYFFLATVVLVFALKRPFGVEV